MTVVVVGLVEINVFDIKHAVIDIDLTIKPSMATWGLNIESEKSQNVRETGFKTCGMPWTIYTTRNDMPCKVSRVDYSQLPEWEIARKQPYR